MKKRKPIPENKIAIYRIDWVDSCTTAGWMPVDVCHTFARICSVGMLAGETPDAYVLTTSLDARNGRVVDQLAIPKCAVKKVSVLKMINKQ